MPFDTSQDSYVAFRSIVAERTSPIVAWVGAGLSRPAGLPTWSGLRNTLVDSLERFANTRSVIEDQRRLRELAQEAKYESNLWNAFSLLQKALGPEEYKAIIRRELAASDTAPVPPAYIHLWRLGLSGMLTLNLDRLATRGYSHSGLSGQMYDFDARGAKNRLHLLKGTHPWLCYLHGMIEDTSSWVFSTSELRRLMKTPGYDELIKTCLIARTVVFIGISPDDVAVGGHLEALTRRKLDYGSHFWITERSDPTTEQWADNSRIRLIRYHSTGDDHSELDELFADLRTFVPADTIAEPVSLTTSSPTATLPDEPELRVMATASLRRALNDEAVRILAPNTREAIDSYSNFLARYSESIYRAWYVTTTPPGNDVLGYTLTDRVAEGAFGTVYRATDAKGSNYAIKILHQKVRENVEMLQSFRRGVRSMKILSENGLQGVVPYHNATEIPAMVVMDFVEGISLTEAVRKHVLEDWTHLLWVAQELTNIIRSSHLLPQRVLHRDIRPNNVMLDSCWGPNPDWADVRVVVLDFDLSWHIDSFDVSITQPGTANGFLAPEQVRKDSGVSTRNSAVDSYGLGMTFFFMRSGVEPRHGEHEYSSWNTTLHDEIQSHKCREWVSVPKRFSRLIHNSTKERQEERWDITRIYGEISRLREAIIEPESIISAELLAEELSARCFGEQYTWNSDRFIATYKMAGTQVDVIGDERKGVVKVDFKWLATDDRDVKRWLGRVRDQVNSAFSGDDWRTADLTLVSRQLWGSAEIKCNSLRLRMGEATTALSKAVDSLNSFC